MLILIVLYVWFSLIMREKRLLFYAALLLYIEGGYTVQCPTLTLMYGYDRSLRF